VYCLVLNELLIMHEMSSIKHQVSNIGFVASLDKTVFTLLAQLA